MYIKRDYSYVCADQTGRDMNIFYPDGFDFSKKLPAIIIFFGGGWGHGAPIYMQPQAMYFASRGMIAITPDYRTYNKDQAIVSDCVKDAKLALKWVYDNADVLCIDKEKLVLSGGSAGGHLAICTSLIPKIDDTDIDVCDIAKAQLLYNPVLDSTKAGFMPKRYDEYDFTNISPNHNMRAGLPPTMIFHGTADSVVSYSQSTTFCEQSTKLGNSCVLHSYPGKDHGFTSFRYDIISFADAMIKSESFLREHGFLPNE